MSFTHTVCLNGCLRIWLQWHTHEPPRPVFGEWIEKHLPSWYVYVCVSGEQDCMPLVNGISMAREQRSGAKSLWNFCHTGRGVSDHFGAISTIEGSYYKHTCICTYVVYLFICIIQIIQMNISILELPPFDMYIVPPASCKLVFCIRLTQGLLVHLWPIPIEILYLNPHTVTYHNYYMYIV